MPLSQFYPVIFSAPRNGYKILACCVGSELHEMGIRMVSDLFEYHGWDSIYLGAAVPKEAILHAIAENQPDLLGLSVTMPQHLPLCREIVSTVREKYPDIKIAVGGRAFLSTNRIWEKWDVDVYTEPIAISAGMAVFGLDTDEIYELIEYADFATYIAKKSGKNKYHAFAKNEHESLRVLSNEN